MTGIDIITNSRFRCLSACARQHYYQYECGLRTEREADYFRIGRVFHVGMKWLAAGKSLPETCDVIRQHYQVRPSWMDEFDWAVECETAMRLVCGWDWYWQNNKLEILEAEQVFQLPIINPETGAPTPLFKRSGKRDQIVRLPDGRIALREFKTTGDDISPDSDYWNILRIDPQISNYFDSGVDIDCIIYDVARKPSISPKMVTTKDDNGFKIVLDANGNRVFKKGGLPRESGDKEAGYVLQQRRETPHEFGERLTMDMGERPEFYFARREIPRTEADIDGFRMDLWQQQQLLRWRQKNNLWPRSPGPNACNFCAFKNPCFNNEYPLGDYTPDGFIRLDNIHPELEVEHNVSANSTTAAQDPADPAITE